MGIAVLRPLALMATIADSCGQLRTVADNRGRRARLRVFLVPRAVVTTTPLPLPCYRHSYLATTPKNTLRRTPRQDLGNFSGFRRGT